MALFLAAAWILVTILQYGGVAVAFTGVAVFGFYFIRANGRAARKGQNAVPAVAWRGQGPKFGAFLLAFGILLQFSSFVLAMALRASA